MKFKIGTIVAVDHTRTSFDGLIGIVKGFSRHREVYSVLTKRYPSVCGLAKAALRKPEFSHRLSGRFCQTAVTCWAVYQH